MRLLIVGDGKMGRAVAALAATRGHEATIIGREENAQGRGLTAERVRGHDVAVEFTRPEASPANLERLIGAGIPVVTGTTGWEAELPRITALVEERKGALLHAANFSIGVHLFLRAARALAGEFAGREGFDGFILEEHHAAKRDAPSGTARALQQRLRDADPSRPYPITSVRAGAIPGTHTVSLDGPFETVTLQHTARSRDGFAAGALAAAEWLPGHTGVYTFDAMLFGDRR
ncbi:MAG TPA: dihydrodipicolinate reductase C-terminal domain-containing protein [Gemmatimonadales bacterium]|jgi:4-hydroxy-tetrahydrodipicolinate reductase|nr:dihydrodipicolinate reductase C-terminal domain-containing protein [Gemmatimonadales bacterium]